MTRLTRGCKDEGGVQQVVLAVAVVGDAAVNERAVAETIRNHHSGRLTSGTCRGSTYSESRLGAEELFAYELESWGHNVVVVVERSDDASLIATGKENESCGFQLLENSSICVVVGVVDVDRNPKYAGGGIRRKYGVVEHPAAVRIAASVVTSGGDNSDHSIARSGSLNHSAINSRVVVIHFATSEHKSASVGGHLGSAGQSATDKRKNEPGRVDHIVYRQHDAQSSIASGQTIFKYSRIHSRAMGREEEEVGSWPTTCVMTVTMGRKVPR